MDTVAFLGYIAAFLTTGSFVPQVMRAYKTKSTADLSWTWLVAFIAGLASWLIYGVILGKAPIVAANAVTLLLCFGLILLKLRYSD